MSPDTKTLKILNQLQSQLNDARADTRQVCIDGNGSKAFYGCPDNEGEVLSALKFQGIVHYDPTELVVCARAGTPLAELEQALAENGQMLACEPPHFGEATVGGMIGAGLSGPRRPYAGSVSDQVLGCTMMNGRGEVLRFGGRVMKNVAGYDLSRLMVGSMGCLGLLLDVTMKVVPKAQKELTCRFEMDNRRIAVFINQLRQQSLPITASAHDGEWLRLRFSGGEAELAALPGILDSLAGFIERETEEDSHWWQSLREHRLPFFNDRRNLWRISVPATTPPLPVPGQLLTEWGGALRWIYSDAPADDIYTVASQHKGHASLFRQDSALARPMTRRFQPLETPLLNWHKAVKSALDPDNLFNVGRQYPEF